MTRKETVSEEILQGVDETPPDAGLSMPVSTHTRPVTFDPLRIYLDEIKRYALLSREEEVELAVRYREKGDVQAAYKLITANLRLVVKIAMDFQRHCLQNFPARPCDNELIGFAKS